MSSNHRGHIHLQSELVMTSGRALTQHGILRIGVVAAMDSWSVRPWQGRPRLCSSPPRPCLSRLNRGRAASPTTELNIPRKSPILLVELLNVGSNPRNPAGRVDVIEWLI